MLKLAMSSVPAILIIHFKNSPHTLACLNSLAKTTVSCPIYILAVQSSNAAALQAHSTQPVIVETKHNGGFAWGNNQLAKRALQDGHQDLILLNNDTTVQPDFIDPLVSQLKNSDVGFVCPKIYFYPGNEFHQSAYNKSDRGKVIWYAGGVIDWNNVYASHWGVDEVDHGQFDLVTTTDFATGCCLAVSKHTIEKIGLMDEKYFLYYEDTDWSLAAHQAGLKIIVEPASVIYHKNAGSTGGSGSTLQQYYQTRNRYHFGMKYAPLTTKLHLFKNTVADLHSPDPILRKASHDALTGKRGFQPLPDIKG